MGKNTLYLSVPCQKSLKTCERDYAFRRLACFLQPLAKYKLPMFLHFLSQTRIRGVSCCHTALERFQHKNYLYSAVHKELQYHLTCNRYCSTGWKSPEQNPACVGLHLHCPFALFQCTARWVTCGLDLNYNWISFCLPTFVFPFLLSIY